ncbi:hypothetical protein MRB53_016058 [Persea americana]|uniref:Uncharacterized protein n=1 Tax=Persea americana TaxID=3435 RepID=A0ACC2M1A6_PERAE|nr:hypothetical protein MRB53_016058 [Persea americana]
MSFKREGKGCYCGGPGAANLLQISSIVSEISRQPCLNNSAIKGNKMLKPEKWQAVYDSEGRVSRFKKALKSIILGGVDPSIRAEVWEFLLGCYALGTTTEYRRQLRMARRERYKDLIKQCQAMHSSIGTGTLAYVVGSKVMDVRTVSKDNGHHEVDSRRSSQDMINDMDADCDLKYCHPESVDACQGGSSSDSTDLVSVRGSIDSVTNGSSYALPPSGPYNRFSSKSREEMHESQYVTESQFNFPPLPVTNLFKKNDVDDVEGEVCDERPSTDRRLRLEDQPMHSFQIDNNVDLIMESNALPSTDFLSGSNGKNEMFNSSIEGPTKESTNLEYSTKTINRHRISDVPEAAMINATSHVATADEERVSEWLWTLHRIVVDVVRTDSHLEFYEDAKNMARMSDILAVYAWVDPATGYCQGMSDLLSPFVVLYEDNADAFWCFEMLLRRMRENFRMEGPTGVIKQLQSLWRVLEQIDAEMYRHLSLIGAESLHFAFRMLLVLFRRELSFNESLRMWEMMWAADFDEAVTQKLEQSCLEPLVLHLPKDLNSERIEESTENGKRNSRGTQSQDVGNADVSKTDSNGTRSASIYPFCGLTSASFWCRNDRMQICTIISTKNGDDELVVFCVAAILSINRCKVIKEACSIDDLIKMFNDKLLKINVRRCIRTAIKLRKKYFYKIIKSTSLVSSEQ